MGQALSDFHGCGVNVTAASTIGEMGLITGQVRNATIEAEVPSVLYVPKTNVFERIKRNHPALYQALLTYVIRVIADGSASLTAPSEL